MEAFRSDDGFSYEPKPFQLGLSLDASASVVGFRDLRIARKFTLFVKKMANPLLSLGDGVNRFFDLRGESLTFLPIGLGRGLLENLGSPVIALLPLGMSSGLPPGSKFTVKLVTLPLHRFDPRLKVLKL